MATSTRYRASRRQQRQRRRERGQWALVALAAISVLVAWLFLRQAPHDHASAPRPRLTMEQARAVNASIPFLSGRVLPAMPFRFRGSPAGREQATQCLATAALYEAGDDDRAQRAVIQVILNRVRLPQYPKTVCGVVYQGAALATGCQFSFTCDQSIVRRPEHRGWQQARHAAQRALSGYVFRPVGQATHYHADWTVPYWIGSMEKIARVRTHIFYQPRSPSRISPAG